MITLNKYQNLLKEAKKVQEVSTFNTLLGLGFQDINSLWSNAVYYNKIQNQLKKDNDNESIVLVIDFKDDVTNEVKPFALRGKHSFTRVQWFKLLLSGQYFHLTRQQTKQILNS